MLATHTSQLVDHLAVQYDAHNSSRKSYGRTHAVVKTQKVRPRLGVSFGKENVRCTLNKKQ